MTELQKIAPRRDFLKDTAGLAAASALTGVVVPRVHAGEDNTIRLALIGCGGRGTGAVADAMSADNGPVKLVAMADAFQDRLNASVLALNKQFGDQISVSKDRQFVGLDAYRHAMDCLRPGDVAIFATPCAFRGVHLGYAVEKGLNVFMEKPITVDGATTRRMLELADAVDAKSLKVGVGLMVRHCRARQALWQQIQDGRIGDLIAMRVCRMHGPWVGYDGPKPQGMNELEFQIRKFCAFLWASGGTATDFYVHQIDECCWMKGAWPVKVQATGGRHFRGNCIDQNFDTYSMDFTFADGAKLFLYGRSINGCYEEFSSHAYGSKGMAIISNSGHAPGRCRIYSGQDLVKEKLVWAFPQPEVSPYLLEWSDLLDAIRNNKPCNEVRRGAEASLVASMGRMAAHTGRVVTWDEMLRSENEFATNLDKLTMESPSPLLPRPDGRYPVPQPGIVMDEEYATSGEEKT